MRDVYLDLARNMQLELIRNVAIQGSNNYVIKDGENSIAKLVLLYISLKLSKNSTISMHVLICTLVVDSLIV